MNTELIYLDNNATTPVDPRVLAAMMPYLTDSYGNAASAHALGAEARRAVDNARVVIGDLINCNPEDLIFTGGATEAINIALQGIIFHQRFRERKHIITVSTEHPAVLDTCHYLESIGVQVTYLGVDTKGLIDFEELKSVITHQTALVSVMMVNNETGIIQPIQRIAELAHQHGALFMTDATQAVGKIPVDITELEIDLLAFSGHKFYGPKGIGGLYVNPELRIKPLIYGGGHEGGLRSGTLNVPCIVGMGVAAQLASIEMNSDQERINGCVIKLKHALLEIEGTFLNSSNTDSLYNTINICFEGIDNEALLLNLKNVCVSNGSACSSYSMEPSHVLLKMGLTKDQANSSLRFSLGKFNTDDEIETTILIVKDVVKKLKTLVA